MLSRMGNVSGSCLFVLGNLYNIIHIYFILVNLILTKFTTLLTAKNLLESCESDSDNTKWPGAGYTGCMDLYKRCHQILRHKGNTVYINLSNRDTTCMRNNFTIDHCTEATRLICQKKTE